MVPKVGMMVCINPIIYQYAVFHNLESDLPDPSKNYLVIGVYSQSSPTNKLVVLQLSYGVVQGWQIIDPTGEWLPLYHRYKNEPLFEEVKVQLNIKNKPFCSPDEDPYCESSHPDEDGPALFNLPQKQCSVCKRPRR